MKRNLFKAFYIQWRLFIPLLFIVLLCTSILSCTTSKSLKEETKIFSSNHKSVQSHSGQGNISSASILNLDLNDHNRILLEPEIISPPISDSSNLPKQTFKTNGESEISNQDILDKEPGMLNVSSAKSPVADKIVKNYLLSKNKEPGGHCLRISKKRFEKAYKDVHGHLVYEDLQDSIATAYYTPREVFDYLYVSASGTHEGWRSLPIEYRGKGSAGAVVYAGMGKLVDFQGIWSGELRPGALMQVWKHKNEYNQVIIGVNKKDFDPYGHSFIFIEYIRDENHKIIGIRIADQGYQSYRPLVPNDYEVWWAANLSI